MAKVDHVYGSILLDVFTNGVKSPDRTGVGTKSLFGVYRSVDVSEEFPLVTLKKTFYRGVFEELLWFLRGGTNAFDLAKVGVNIWLGDAHAKYAREVDPNCGLEEFTRFGLDDPKFAKLFGELGPVYGAQWVNWNGQINQIAELIENLKKNPYSRRHMVTAWNVSDIEKMTLPPCHYGFQVNVHENEQGQKVLDLIWNQRSVDMGLGWTFDMASYAALLYMIAQQTDMIPGFVGCNLGNTHIYNNHEDAVREILSRDADKYKGCKLVLNKAADIFSYKIDDFVIDGYDSYKPVKMKLNN